jgi:hypothetical protein
MVKPITVVSVEEDLSLNRFLGRFQNEAHLSDARSNRNKFKDFLVQIRTLVRPVRRHGLIAETLLAVMTLVLLHLLK